MWCGSLFKLDELIAGGDASEAAARQLTMLEDKVQRTEEESAQLRERVSELEGTLASTENDLRVANSKLEHLEDKAGAGTDEIRDRVKQLEEQLMSTENDVSASSHACSSFADCFAASLDGCEA